MKMEICIWMRLWTCTRSSSGSNSARKKDEIFSQYTRQSDGGGGVPVKSLASVRTSGENIHGRPNLSTSSPSASYYV